MVHVIVTYNRKEYLAKCLVSLWSTIPMTDTIAVWDNNSDDGTEKMMLEGLEAFGMFTGDIGLMPKNIIYYKSPVNYGCAGGRNRSFEKWKDFDNSPYMCMNDDDYYFEEGWHQRCLETFGSCKNVGFVTVHSDQNPNKTLVVDVEGGYERRTVITSSQMMIEKSVYERTKGYIETGRLMGWISRDFCKRILKLGLFPIRALSDKKLVRNMDHNNDPLNLNDQYEESGYNRLRRLSKAGQVEVGDTERARDGLSESK